MPIMVALMSEKSRLIRPGVMMMSLMPCTAWRSRSSATLKDSKKLVPLGTSFSRRSLGMAMTVSTVAREAGETPFAHAQRAEALAAEGLGDHGDGERVELLGEGGDDRRGAGAGAAAQTRGDEDHVRALQEFDDAIGVFERGLAADFWVGTGAQTLGDFGA